MVPPAYRPDGAAGEGSGEPCIAVHARCTLTPSECTLTQRTVHRPCIDPRARIFFFFFFFLERERERSIEMHGARQIHLPPGENLIYTPASRRNCLIFHVPTHQRWIHRSQTAAPKSKTACLSCTFGHCVGTTDAFRCTVDAHAILAIVAVAVAIAAGVDCKRPAACRSAAGPGVTRGRSPLADAAGPSTPHARAPVTPAPGHRSDHSSPGRRAA